LSIIHHLSVQWKTFQKLWGEIEYPENVVKTIKCSKTLHLKIKYKQYTQYRISGPVTMPNNYLLVAVDTEIMEIINLTNAKKRLREQ